MCISKTYPGRRASRVFLHFPRALENGARALLSGVAGITNSIDFTLSGNSPAIGSGGKVVRNDDELPFSRS